MNATARRQLRAYVAVKEVRIDKLDENARPEAHITIRNYGQTPAYEFAVSAHVDFAQSFAGVHAAKEPDGTMGHLAPGGEFYVNPTSRIRGVAEG
jgi:hypothetical protein